MAAVVSQVGGGTMGREDVEELAADVFAAFWNSAQDFSADRDVKPWLAVRKEQTEILNRAVEALEQPDREIFARFYFLGEKVSQIAAKLAMNPSTVKTRLRRSRGKLMERKKRMKMPGSVVILFLIICFVAALTYIAAKVKRTRQRAWSQTWITAASGWTRRMRRHRNSRAPIIEAAFLFAVGMIPGSVADLPVTALISFIMGYQLCLFRSCLGVAHNTTICTGNLRNVGQLLYKARWGRDEKNTEKLVCFALLTFSFAVGAVPGTLLSQTAGARAVWLCSGALISQVFWM